MAKSVTVDIKVDTRRLRSSLRWVHFGVSVGLKLARFEAWVRRLPPPDRTADVEVFPHRKDGTR